MLADLESIEKRTSGLVRKIKSGEKEAVLQNKLLHDAKAALEEGRPARTVEVKAEDQKQWEMLQLLTSKPVLFVCNVPIWFFSKERQFNLVDPTQDPF